MNGFSEGSESGEEREDAERRDWEGDGEHDRFFPNTPGKGKERGRGEREIGERWSPDRELPRGWVPRREKPERDIPRW